MIRMLNVNMIDGDGDGDLHQEVLVFGMKASI
jgi:hypothetical protein